MPLNITALPFSTYLWNHRSIFLSTGSDGAVDPGEDSFGIATTNVFSPSMLPADFLASGLKKICGISGFIYLLNNAGVLARIPCFPNKTTCWFEADEVHDISVGCIQSERGFQLSSLFVLKKNNVLLALGESATGQLGIRKNDQFIETLTHIQYYPHRYGEIRQIEAGATHTVLLTQAAILVAGENALGQLGFLRHSPAQSYFFRQLDLPPQYNGIGDIKKIAVGAQSTLILFNNGDLLCCGLNTHHNLGLPNHRLVSPLQVTQPPLEADDKIIDIFASKSGHFTFLLTENNQLWACGNNGRYQLGLPQARDYLWTQVPLPDNIGIITEVAMGRAHTVLITRNNQLWGTGDNRRGQLGFSDLRQESQGFAAIAYFPARNAASLVRSVPELLEDSWEVVQVFMKILAAFEENPWHIVAADALMLLEVLDESVCERCSTGYIS